MRLLLKILPLLFLLPTAFALAPDRTLTPIELVWYMVGFCAFVILLILHHMILENDLKRRKKA